ncbi:PrsW family glutamic-type intramembrane protease [Natrinema thermotolerans]|uniref:PrsW family glutamic-type intramembrane protease n=1 Tax=Natrinema thermotolerans TaxID=121872 RepID=A0AAF0T2U8_9EURY|nr:PrsW family glutamic-type intramembrane protease [Natrinema thermotolerans]QCC57624.1 ABC transporter permease [Natrinema thermotolerans]WMT08702.1 PrsW family glutamic-type intramembrane protease [Natrinema thermotolerans]
MSDGRRSAFADRLRRLSNSIARTGRIARWEVTSSAGTVDRKTAVALVVLVLAAGTAGVSVSDEGLGLEREIYVVGVAEESQYHDVAVEAEQFRPVPLEDVVAESGGGNADTIALREDANVDVVVTRDGRIAHDGPNGAAAYDEFRSAVETYNANLMDRESDQAAAYPVLVSLEYQDRDLGGTTADGTSDDGGGTADESSDGGDGTTDGGTDSDGDEPATGGGGGGDDGGNDRLQVPNVGGDSGASSAPGTPGSIAPPFPFDSLVLAFLFVVPMNFVIQAYGSTIMDERLNRRGELLLVSPASSREIVAGKTLPYLLGLVGIVVAIAVGIGGSPLAVAAALPIALLFLAASFTGAMFARSFKELTFVTVTISVFLTTYTFIPAIFTDVNPIALISPLTLIVMDLQDESVRLGEYLFSTGPFYLSAAVLFLLGVGVYREEDMFAQKPIPAKVLDAVANRLHGRRSVALLSILFIPFVFAGQLLSVALLFAVPEVVAVPAMVVAAAAIEELAKSVGVYAGFARSRFDATAKTAVVLGAFSGAGFFLGEKVTHVVQFVGLPDLPVGTAAFGPAVSSDPLLLAVVFLAPLALHVVTAICSAVGASRGRTGYAVGFLAATIVHVAYNLGVLTLVA